MSDSKSNDKPALPPWAIDSFSRFMEHQNEVGLILALSMRGITMLPGRHDAMKVVAKIPGTRVVEKENLERAARERDLAQREIDNDFPLLYEQATVALWGSLETLVRSFSASWLVNRPGAWQTEAVKKLRVRLGDYEALEPLDRCLWVVDLLDQEANGPLRAGVGRFESLLERFQLNGRVEEECRKTLFELSEVRHAIVHRGGHADRKLIEACPWLSLKPGERIKISHEMWLRYNDAVTQYVLEIIRRVRVTF